MRALALVTALAACGGATQIAIGPTPPPTTSGVLSGPLCNNDRCTCRDAGAPGDGGAGVPPDAGHKRFEIRLKSPQALWATVGQTRLYKNAEQAEACFYVDLPAGATPVELRAHDPNGAAAEWDIRELGAKTKSYYDTFLFDCGVPGVCSFDELDSMKQSFAGLKQNLHDACGSTKVKGLTWDTGRSPDQLHPSELLVRLSLDIYTFEPWKPHGDPACGHGRPPKDGGSGAPDDSGAPDYLAPPSE